MMLSSVKGNVSLVSTSPFKSSLTAARASSVDDNSVICNEIICDESEMMMEGPSCMATRPSLTFLTKEAIKRARLIDINEWITCYLCGGYLVDATTLVDCSTLHSFCRSCILKYLHECQATRTRPTCPVCETALNETKPHASLRLDRKLQDIVYKLVPGLFKRTASHALLSREAGTTFYDPGDKISLSLEYISSSSSSLDNIRQSNESSSQGVLKEANKKENSSEVIDRKYLLCLAGMPVSLLKKFIVQKYGLDARYSVQLLYNNTVLTDDLTIMDVIYIYSWAASDPMKFSYRIESTPLVLKRSAKTPMLSTSSPSSTSSSPASNTGQQQQPPPKKQRTNDADTLSSKNGRRLVPPKEVSTTTTTATSAAVKTLAKSNQETKVRVSNSSLASSCHAYTPNVQQKKQRASEVNTLCATQQQSILATQLPHSINGKKACKELSKQVTASTLAPVVIKTSPESSLRISTSCLLSPASSFRHQKSSPKSPKSPKSPHKRSHKSSHSSSSPSSSQSKVSFHAQVTDKGITIVRELVHDSNAATALLKIPKPQGGSYPSSTTMSSNQSSQAPNSSPAAGSTAPSLLSPSAPSPSHSYSYSASHSTPYSLPSPSASCSPLSPQTSTAMNILTTTVTPNSTSAVLSCASSSSSPPYSFSSSSSKQSSSTSTCVAGVSTSVSTSPSSSSSCVVRLQKEQHEATTKDITAKSNSTAIKISSTKIQPLLNSTSSSLSKSSVVQSKKPTESTANTDNNVTPLRSTTITPSFTPSLQSKITSDSSEISLSKDSVPDNTAAITAVSQVSKNDSNTKSKDTSQHPVSPSSVDMLLLRKQQQSTSLPSSLSTTTTGSISSTKTITSSQSVSSPCQLFHSPPVKTSPPILSSSLKTPSLSSTFSKGISDKTSSMKTHYGTSKAVREENNKTRVSSFSVDNLLLLKQKQQSTPSLTHDTALSSEVTKSTSSIETSTSKTSRKSPTTISRLQESSSSSKRVTDSGLKRSCHASKPLGVEHMTLPPPAHLPRHLREHFMHPNNPVTTTSLIPPYSPHLLCRPAPSRPQAFSQELGRSSTPMPSSMPSSVSPTVTSGLPLASHASLASWAHAMSSLYNASSSISRRDK